MGGPSAGRATSSPATTITASISAASPTPRLTRITSAATSSAPMPSARAPWGTARLEPSSSARRRAMKSAALAPARRTSLHTMRMMESPRLHSARFASAGTPFTPTAAWPWTGPTTGSRPTRRRDFRLREFSGPDRRVDLGLRHGRLGHAHLRLRRDFHDPRLRQPDLRRVGLRRSAAVPRRDDRRSGCGCGDAIFHDAPDARAGRLLHHCPRGGSGRHPLLRRDLRTLFLPTGGWNAAARLSSARALRGRPRERRQQRRRDGSGLGPGHRGRCDCKAGPRRSAGPRRKRRLGFTEGSSLTATFPLAGAAQGAWDVVVTNPGNHVATLTAGFTVESGTAPGVFGHVVGRRLLVLRAGREQTFFLVFGNSGNVDAPATEFV